MIKLFKVPSMSDNDQTKAPPKLGDLRKKRNKELIQRMQNGDSLMRYDSSASWFPPRPIIKKDPKALEVLHGSDQTKKKIPKKTDHLQAIEKPTHSPPSEGGGSLVDLDEDHRDS